MGHRCLCRFEYARQIDFERRSFSHLARHPNVSAALFHDPVYGGESETGALTLFLRREKWFEDVRLCLFIHSRAAISHREDNIFSRHHGESSAAYRFREIDVVSSDDQLAAL